MVRNPEVQRKAQREIDLHIGSSRLPSFKDRPNLPYVVALAKEVLRWHAVAPQGAQSTLISSRLEVIQMRTILPGIPHMLREDDVYNGYFIPAGTIIVGNTWYCLILSDILLLIYASSLCFQY